MKNICLIFIIGIFIIQGCGITYQGKSLMAKKDYSPSTTYTFNLPYEQVWKGITKTCMNMNLSIDFSDKGSGILRTKKYRIGSLLDGIYEFYLFEENPNETSIRITNISLPATSSFWGKEFWGDYGKTLAEDESIKKKRSPKVKEQELIFLNSLKGIMGIK